MGTRRKDLLKRVESLAQEIQTHLDKVDASPESRDVPHWRGEIRGWIARCEDALRHLGRKTADQWRERLDDFRERLEK